MNIVNLIGRLTDDVTERTSQSGTCIVEFPIAVRRDYKDSKGEYQSDFFTCKAFGKTAEFIAKYFRKGMKTALTGGLVQERWKDGDQNKSRVTVRVDKAEFVEKRGAQTNTEEPKADENGFIDIPIDEELPFI